MKTRWMETPRSRSVPAPRVITLPERTIADHDQTPGGEACAQIRFWGRRSNYVWATGAAAMGLSLHFYYVREMLASLALFSLLFFSLTLVVLGVFAVWYAGNQAAIWAGSASRVVIALFQRQDYGDTELSPIPVVAGERRLSEQRSELET